MLLHYCIEGILNIINECFSLTGSEAAREAIAKYMSCAGAPVDAKVIFIQ